MALLFGDTDLDYCGIEWFALETNSYHSVVFEISPKYCILDSCLLRGSLLYVIYSQGEMSIPQKWVSISNIHQRENRSHSFSLSNNMTFNVPHAEDLWCEVKILILKADQSGQKSNKQTLKYGKITLMNLWSWAALVVMINITLIQRIYIKLLSPIGKMLSFFSENLNLILLKLFWSI